MNVISLEDKSYEQAKIIQCFEKNVDKLYIYVQIQKLCLKYGTIESIEFRLRIKSLQESLCILKNQTIEIEELFPCINCVVNEVFSICSTLFSLIDKYTLPYTIQMQCFILKYLSINSYIKASISFSLYRENFPSFYAKLSKYFLKKPFSFKEQDDFLKMYQSLI